MLDNNIIEFTHGCLENISEISSIAMIIRHAERDMIPDNESGYHIDLTEKGRRDSVKFGEEISNVLRRLEFDLDIYTSPVPRCVNTAENIIAGTKREITYEKTCYLGDPGVYISNDIAAGEAFLNRKASDVIDEYLREGRMKGFFEPEVAGSKLLSFIKKYLDYQNNLSVHISHDAVIAPFAYYLAAKNSGVKIWPDFLEGIVFIKKKDKITCWLGNSRFNIPEV